MPARETPATAKTAGSSVHLNRAQVVFTDDEEDAELQQMAVAFDGPANRTAESDDGLESLDVVDRTCAKCGKVFKTAAAMKKNATRHLQLQRQD